ncbi:MAG: RNA 2',3'-cyclic phosphodiesterase [Eubacteriales bacterium]|jgi:2'-5' RNA ligase|nr:RNA 2',3'-cyclic phosphodiesterase [Eubacteriales bacterium]MDD4104429.1 RNA 2',3'-cyclic phosphodiesterase [Eubacteriales bacterium]MDD4709624.1 RNA 2',3'-cyclic phosphodiesterase [Eubacteriales bacterium]
MRLFIAVEFPDAIKAELEKSTSLLRDACNRGIFSRRENYHITLVFLGEIPFMRVAEITQTMDSCVCPPIPITIGRLDRFERDGGDVFWRAIRAPGSLAGVRQSLAKALTVKGLVPAEEKEFRPHLTLARQAILREGAQLWELSEKLPDLEHTAMFMTLMQSERIGGKLTYSPIYRADFRG